MSSVQATPPRHADDVMEQLELDLEVEKCVNAARRPKPPIRSTRSFVPLVDEYIERASGCTVSPSSATTGAKDRKAAARLLLACGSVLFLLGGLSLVLSARPQPVAAHMSATVSAPKEPAVDSPLAAITPIPGSTFPLPMMPPSIRTPAQLSPSLPSPWPLRPPPALKPTPPDPKPPPPSLSSPTPSPSPKLVRPRPLQPPPPPPPTLIWHEFANLNCYRDRGALDLEGGGGDGASASGAASVAACKDACLQRADCEAIVYYWEGESQGHSCWLKRHISQSSCAFDMFARLYRASWVGSNQPQRSASVFNERFALTEPTNDPRRAGVFVHQFTVYDGHLAGTWQINPFDEGKWSDRFSATLINRETPTVFDSGKNGFILSPRDLKILCSYASDGGTDRRLCDPPGGVPGCTPGCGLYEVVNAEPEWCFDEWEECSWPATWARDKLAGMMRQRSNLLNDEAHMARCGYACHYNEIVIEADAWVDYMPYTIEAVFFTMHEMEEEARRVRAKFLETFGRSLPLLRLDLQNLVEPFTLAG